MFENAEASSLSLDAKGPLLPEENPGRTEKLFLPPKRWAYADEPSRFWLAKAEQDGVEKRFITIGVRDAKVVRRVVATVGDLLRSRPDLYRVSQERRGQVQRLTRAGTNLLACLNDDVIGVAERLGDQQRIHPYFTIFNELVQKYVLMLQDKQALPETLDAFARELRSLGSQPDVVAQIRNSKRVERDNARSAAKLLADVRASFSKVLALRFDLEYLVDFPSFNPKPVDEKLMKRHREAFLALLRDGPYAQHMVGYVWKTEWGLQRGFHHHLLVLLNGQSVCADIRIADDLCMRWKHEITRGLGSFENCNKRKEQYRRCGIGMLNRNDEEKWGFLAEATRYLTKQDVYTKALLSKNTQCFGVGGPYLCTPVSAQKRQRLKKTLPPVSGASRKGD